MTNERVRVELNTDFSTKGLSSLEITSIVAAWQSGALSRETMTDLFRRGEVLPEGRSTEEEVRLIGADQRVVVVTRDNTAAQSELPARRAEF